MDLRAALSMSVLLSAATPTDLDDLARAVSSRRLRKGQLLFSEGERSEHLYVLVSGRVKVVRLSHLGDELLLTVLGPGESLGELSVLDGQARSATAQALDDVELLSVPAHTVLALLERSPALALVWAQEVAGTVRRLTGSTADLVFLDLPRRLVKLLLETGSDDVELGLSQTEVAARLGVARQSLNRALSGLQRRGWVRVDSGRTVLLDRPALERFAGS